MGESEEDLPVEVEIYLNSLWDVICETDNIAFWVEDTKSDLKKLERVPSVFLKKRQAELRRKILKARVILGILKRREEEIRSSYQGDKNGPYAYLLDLK